MDDVISTQHVLVCALQELGCLVQGLSTNGMSLIHENLLDHVLSVLLHPAPAAQLLAAWCLRCITVAAPSQATPLIDRCINRISSLKSSGEAVGGYAHTLAALVGGVYQCPLGIPHAKGRVRLLLNHFFDYLKWKNIMIFRTFLSCKFMYKTADFKALKSFDL